MSGPRGRTGAGALGRIAALLSLGLASAPAAAQPPPPVSWPPSWEEARYNPRPASGDLVLPIPCGGAMAFRFVPTPAGDGPLDDRTVTLGSGEPGAGPAEFLRTEALAGPFPAPAGDGRGYWIGKYEVTRDQWQAVMDARCPEPSAAGLLPVTGVSWFEAVAFSARLSAAVLAGARDRLPEADGVPGFLRLPTEAEWEYAARGGPLVPEIEFAARTPPWPEGALRHAWVAGPRSSDGRPQPVGLLAPDALGLHDMFGNAAEMMLEPFRLNRVGRLHGQAGGVILRGGDFRTPEAALRSSLRVEIPPFDPATGQPTALPTMGLRLVIAAPATRTLPRGEALARAFDAEARARDRALAEPRAALELLRRTAPDERTRLGVARVEAALATAERARADEARAVLRAQVEAAAVLARATFLSQRRMDGLQALIDTAEVMRATPEMRADWVRLLEGIRAEREASLEAYARILGEVQRRAEAPEVAAARGVLEREFAGRGLAELAPFLEVASRHGAAERLPERPRLLAEVLAAGRGGEPPARTDAPPAVATVPPATAPAARPTEPARPAAPPRSQAEPGPTSAAPARPAPPGTGAIVSPTRP
ncbi:MAG: SUMF1/EgtB/PvdO family nonheme iron enzyme [Acetobacteraceae bacterium]|nr:SUMF1/EgtB/PvdO family nonheme iron enzyme [Acetobacteraceae bacterium]